LQTEHLQKISTLKKASATAIRLLDLLYSQPLVSVPSVAKKLKVTAPAARKAINNLEKLKILKEISGKKRDRVYLYEPYFSIIEGI
jgi:Fic family protein